MNAGSSRISRRQVLLASLGALGMALLFSLRQLFAQTEHGKKSWLAFDGGKPESYALHQVDGRFRASQGLWIVHHLDSLYALSVKTPEGHLTDWNEAGQYFCTASGRRYYKSGISCPGSGGKSLVRVAVTLTRQGHLEFDPARTFRQERGEWAHPLSFFIRKETGHFGTGFTKMQSPQAAPGTVPLTVP